MGFHFSSSCRHTVPIFLDTYSKNAARPLFILFECIYQEFTYSFRPVSRSTAVTGITASTRRVILT